MSKTMTWFVILLLNFILVESWSPKSLDVNSQSSLYASKSVRCTSKSKKAFQLDQRKPRLPKHLIVQAMLENSQGKSKEDIEFFREFSEGTKEFQTQHDKTIELGLFPMIIDDEDIGSVLLPGGAMPLNIFAMKFRSLFSRTLDGKEQAGMVYFDGPSKQYAAVGTLIQIDKFESLPDGRIMVICFGRFRFRIVEILRAESEEGYCRVRAQLIDDERLELEALNAGQDEATAIEEERQVWGLLQQVLDQTNRLYGKSLRLSPSVMQLAPLPSNTSTETPHTASGGFVAAGAPLPDRWSWCEPEAASLEQATAAQRMRLRRRLFSLEVAQLLSCPAVDLQRLLQAPTTSARLRLERGLLNEASRILVAQLALKNVGVL